MEHLAEGTIAPDFELSSVDGTAFRLSEHTARGPVMLAFYKGACPTCQMTFPFIERLFEGFGPRVHPAIWGISQDEAEETRSFARRFGLRFPVLVDDHPYPVSSDYELHYVPTVYLIDRKGRIELADFGFSKAALNRVAEAFSAHWKRPTPALFDDAASLPERRPG